MCSLTLSLCLTLSSVYFPWVTAEYGREWSEMNPFLSRLFFSLCVCSDASGPGHPEWQHKLHNCQWPGPHLPQRHHGKPSGENNFIVYTIRCMMKYVYVCLTFNRGQSELLIGMCLGMDRLMDKSLWKDFKFNVPKSHRLVIWSWMLVSVCCKIVCAQLYIL